MSMSTSADTQLPADLNSHQITGIAWGALARGHYPSEAYFKLPLVTHAEDNLWVGGCINGVGLPHDFDVVVSLDAHENYELGPSTVRVVLPMTDTEQVDRATVLRAVEFAAGALERGSKTLIHSVAGLNRSILVAALALVSLGRRTPRQAVGLLRERRSPVALCNQAFEDFLLIGAHPW